MTVAHAQVALVPSALLAVAVAAAHHGEPQTKWKRVDVLSTHGTLVAQDAKVHYIDVSTTAPPREVFRRCRDGYQTNSNVALDREGRAVFINDGETITRLDHSGNATTIARLHEMKTDEPIPDDAMLNWHLSVSASGRLYFAVFAKGTTGFLGELDPSDRVLRRLPLAAHGVAVDGESRAAFLARRRTLEIGVFESGRIERHQLARDYHQAHLSPDRSKLVLARHALAEEQPIAIYDLGTQTERSLPIEGSFAVWLTNEVLLFGKGENELWRHDVDGETEMLFSVPREPRRGGSYAKPPVISRSGRLLAWGFATGAPDETRLRTIVVDLERGEYRLLDDWWHNIALLDG